MRYSVIALLTGLFTSGLASPAPSGLKIIDHVEDAFGVDATPSLLADVHYISAWESVTGVVPENAAVIPADAVSKIQDVKRVVGPINGQNNYVALYYRNRRYVVTLVIVSNIAGGLADGLVNTPEIATAVARSARTVMGNRIGKWSFASWGYYSNIAQGAAFTIVAKNMFPPIEYEQALEAARALAAAYGLSSNIPWAYPQNNKRDNNSDIHNFSILADFTPSLELAEYLFNNFHNVNHTSMTEGASQSLLSKRDNFCSDYNEKARIKSGWAPWNTQYGAGCVGSSSDFDHAWD
jgi:hypothetical protein